MQWCVNGMLIHETNTLQWCANGLLIAETTLAGFQKQYILGGGI